MTTSFRWTVLIQCCSTFCRTPILAERQTKQIKQLVKALLRLSNFAAQPTMLACTVSEQNRTKWNRIEFLLRFFHFFAANDDHFGQVTSSVIEILLSISNFSLCHQQVPCFDVAANKINSFSNVSLHERQTWFVLHFNLYWTWKSSQLLKLTWPRNAWKGECDVSNVWPDNFWVI